MVGLGLMESWFCIWDHLANPKIELNLVPNPIVPEHYEQLRMIENLKVKGWYYGNEKLTESDFLNLFSEITGMDFFIKKNILFLGKESNDKITLSKIYGESAFPFHNDGIQNPTPPRFLVLKLVSLEKDVAKTFLLDGFEIALNNKNLFYNSIFKLRGNSFTELTPIINVIKFEQKIIRYNPVIMNSIKKYKKTQIEELISLSDKIIIDWLPEKFLIIDNWRLLHSREKVNNRTKKRIIERLEFYYKKYE
jgi:hypothetical protein